MHVISIQRLRDFWEEHPQAEGPLRAWHKVVSKADWKNFAELKQTYSTASIYKDCVVFNIKGNDFRLIVKVRYRWGKVFVTEVMTHSEYDRDKWKEKCECQP